ncbi:cytochrome b/b6 domain-containing protein [Sphingomonas sp.]|uniref:cytochrome b n=1 Tax=Sphingomonas sp. TaxID=28214 RepID=UPI0025E9C9C0|nr:cytochrome b/b6 domain-containing protein [Sphingomonas sp.]MBV9527069.1 cytochrome b [Sphingomonas sp.]
MADRTIEARDQHPLRRYSNVAVTFHWLTVALVLFQLWLGFSFADLAQGPRRTDLFTWHRTIGAVILLVAIARLTYRLMNPPPPYPPELPAWERAAGTWNHRLFYLLLIAIPIGGLLAVSGHTEGPTITLLGGVQIPKVPGISKDFGELAANIHVLAVWLLILLMALHVAAALKHQFIDRNRAAGRMPPFRDPVDEPVVIGQGSAARSED